MKRRVKALLLSVVVLQVVLLSSNSGAISTAECQNLDLQGQLSTTPRLLTETGDVGATQLFSHVLTGDRGQKQEYVSARRIQMRMEFFNRPFVSPSSENDEFYRLQPGAFAGTSKLVSSTKARLLSDKLLKSYVHVDELTCGTVVRHPVVFVERFEYANLYHTMTDFVNAFLALRQSDLAPADVQFLLFDHHGAGTLDSVWQDVYSPNRPVLRPEFFRNTTATGGVCFDHAIFVLPGYDSPIYSKAWSTQSPCRSASLPVEFSRFFYEAYHLEPHPPATVDDDNDAEEAEAEAEAEAAAEEEVEEKQARPLEVTLVLRNDYVAHPRNPSGRVVRKWNDNKKLIEALRQLCTEKLQCRVSAVDFAVMDFPQQMHQIAKTDILVGVHGAGLGHAMFLPKGGYLIEVGSNFVIFQDFARWTGSQAILVHSPLGDIVAPPRQLFLAVGEAVRHILRWEKLTDLDSSLDRHLAALQSSSVPLPHLLFGAFFFIVALVLVCLIVIIRTLRHTNRSTAPILGA